MVIVCWAAKGGSGTTVVAAGIALARPLPTLLVDLRGDLPAALGTPPCDRPGVGDWLASPMPPGHLADLVVDIAPDRSLLPWRQTDRDGRDRRDDRDELRTDDPGADRWAVLGDWLAAWEIARGGTVVVDAGTGEPPAALLAVATHRLLVTRPCYLSLRRATHAVARPSAVVLVDEPWRSYRARDIESALGVPIWATVAYDPAIARAVDAGTLLGRSPGRMAKQLRGVAA